LKKAKRLYFCAKEQKNSFFCYTAKVVKNGGKANDKDFFLLNSLYRSFAYFLRILYSEKYMRNKLLNNHVQKVKN